MCNYNMEYFSTFSKPDVANNEGPSVKMTWMTLARYQDEIPTQ